MPDQATSDTSAREVAAKAARLRFEKATEDMAAERRFGGPDFASTEVDVMDEAARLIREARTIR